MTAVANASRNLSLDQLSDRDLLIASQLDANWDTLGWVYFARGNMDKAQKYVRSAWVLGQHGEVGDHLAQIYQKMGRKDDAIRIYAESLSGIRPIGETRTRLATLVGGDGKVTPVVEQHRPELQQSRTINSGKLRLSPAQRTFLSC